MNLEKAVESTTSCHCTDLRRLFSDFSPHRMGDTISAKNQKKDAVNQHIRNSRYDSTAFFRLKKMIFLFAFFCTLSVHALGDARAGEVKSTVCAACHGAKGVSPNPEWPSLAGQNSAYFVKQLNDFRLNHSRASTVMTPLVAGLNTQDMEDLAAFYASLPIPEGSTPMKYLDRGERLYRGGDFDKHITACIACHGPKGTGNAEAGFPVVSGQQAAYIVLQLQQFKENKRRNDLNSIMRDISAQMSHEDMDSVAHYMAGLH